MEQIEFKRRFLHQDIWVQINKMEEEVVILLVGGDKGHVGALSIADEGGRIQTTTFPEHKEAVITEKWAQLIAQHKKCRAIVLAGIHYDNIKKEQIQEILRQTDELLNQVLGWL